MARGAVVALILAVMFVFGQFVRCSCLECGLVTTAAATSCHRVASHQSDCAHGACEPCASCMLSADGRTRADITASTAGALAVAAGHGAAAWLPDQSGAHGTVAGRSAALPGTPIYLRFRALLI